MLKTRKNIKNNTTKNNTKKNNTKKNNTKKNNTKKNTNSKKTLTLKTLHNVVYEKASKINLTPEVFNKHISEFESKELFQKQKDKFKYVKNLVSGELANFELELVNFKSKKIHEYKPPADKQDDESCIKSKYDVNKMESIGSGAFGNAFKITTKDKKTYAIKVIDFSKLETEDVQFYIQDLSIKNIEKEASIAKKMGELNIGPKIHDVYYCISNGIIKYYFVMDYMNQGTLNGYTEKNKITKLPNEHIKQIMNKIHKMHKHGIIHDDLHMNNILVNKKNGKIEFYIADFGLSKSLKQKNKNEVNREADVVEKYITHGDVNFDIKNDKNKKIEYIAKYILSHYTIDN